MSPCQEGSGSAINRSQLRQQLLNEVIPQSAAFLLLEALPFSIQTWSFCDEGETKQSHQTSRKCPPHPPWLGLLSLCISTCLCTHLLVSLSLSLSLSLSPLSLALSLCISFCFYGIRNGAQDLVQPDKHCNTGLCPFPFPLFISLSVYLGLSFYLFASLSLSHCFYFFLFVCLFFHFPPLFVFLSHGLCLCPPHPLLSLSASSFLSHHLCICSLTSGDVAL